MEDISIALDISEGFQYLNEFRCPSIKYQETGNVYVYLKFPDDSVDTIGNVVIYIHLYVVLLVLLIVFVYFSKFYCQNEIYC